MFNKDWTPDQINKLTMIDFLIMSREKAPPDPYASGTGELRSADDVLALKARLEAEQAAEAEAWKGVQNG